VVKLNGITEIALTKLDVLDSFERIKMCGTYRCGSRRYQYFPTTVRALDRCKPEYETLDGWNEKVNRDGRMELPPKAVAYVTHVEKLVGCKIRLISLGPDRRAVIERK
jgi:adenylosuccinate synthase